MGTLLAFSIVCAGVLVLRRTDPHLARPFRAPGMPWVGLAGLLVWLAVGLAIYFLYERRNVERTRPQAR
jgi:APA family basic amino acid/polyamine antiporter